MSLGLKILTARERLGLTQEQVAKAANMRARYYSSIEDDEIERPTPLTLQKIADALSVSLEYLIGDEDPKETIEEVLSPGYAAFVRWVMGLVIILGVLCLSAVFVGLFTYFFWAASGKLSKKPTLGAVSEPISTLASNQAYIETQNPLHLQSHICHVDDK
jgi:transcriptional regulator with XRE-family HTH domain